MDAAPEGWTLDEGNGGTRGWWRFECADGAVKATTPDDTGRFHWLSDVQHYRRPEIVTVSAAGSCLTREEAITAGLASLPHLRVALAAILLAEKEGV